MSSSPHVGTDLNSFSFSIRYPESDEVRPECEQVASFLKYCMTVKRPGDYAQRSHFSPELLWSWIGNIMILDYLPDQNDFRYRVYGTNIALQSGFDMTRKLVSDFKGEIGDFFLRLYRESIDKRAIIFSINTGVHTRDSCNWHRIICPVEREQTLQIVACYYPRAWDT